MNVLLKIMTLFSTMTNDDIYRKFSLTKVMINTSK